MTDKTELRMNLTAIKRIDPYAKDILDSSAHVAFYTFNSEENEWEKTDVEGALFIYSRNAEPFHSIFINNRINTNSFVEPITGYLELQSQPPFLLYRNERSRIRGFWFYNSSECDRIGEIVRRLINECGIKKDGNNIQKNLDVIIPGSSHINIFTMLSKAQEEFNNSTNIHPVAVPAPIPAGNIANICMPTVQNLESRTLFSNFQQNNNNKVHPDLTSQSVMNFFANAKPAVTSEAPPLFTRLISSPVPVEQIEKQQRATTPHESGRAPSPIISTAPINVISMKNTGVENHSPKIRNNKDIMYPLVNLSIHENDKGSGTKITTDLDLQQKLIQKLANTYVGTPPPPPPGMMNHQNNNNTGSGGTKPELMPPTMFLASTASETSLLPQQSATINNSNRILTGYPLKDGLSVTTSTTIGRPEPLTQMQLQQAMHYLLQNDPDFIRKLHEAYLKFFNEKVSV